MAHEGHQYTMFSWAPEMRTGRFIGPVTVHRLASGSYTVKVPWTPKQHFPSRRDVSALWTRRLAGRWRLAARVLSRWIWCFPNLTEESLFLKAVFEDLIPQLHMGVSALAFGNSVSLASLR